MRTVTERLVLRDWQDADFAPFLRHTNTPAVMRWLGGVMDEGTCSTLVAKLIGWSEELGHTFWAVERRDDGEHLSGELLGFCGLKRADKPPGPVGDFEIGWRLREDAWGHGYAREAAEECLRLAFMRYAAPHVVALTTIGNTASWGLMERLGMARRADLDFTLEPDGRFGAETIIVYAMTRDLWGERAR
ncbi:MAG TPA: GNAT family N-acetyltransferase [Croceicoccus sp.]|nr:GNAT family N-acetyltransferase [Croceicoccus sp.]